MRKGPLLPSDELRKSTFLRKDDRTTSRDGLRYHDAEPFVARTEHEEVQGLHDRGHVSPDSGPAHPVLDPELGGQLSHLRGVGELLWGLGGPDHHQSHLGQLLHDQRACTKEGRDVLSGMDASHGSEEKVRRSGSELSPHGVEALCGAKSLHVDRVVQDLDLRPQPTPAKDPGRRVRDAEHAVCRSTPHPGQHVEDRRGAVEGVPAVVEHMRDPRPAGGEGTIEHDLHVRVDHLDALLPNDSRDRPGASKQAERVEHDVARSHAPPKHAQRSEVYLGPKSLVGSDVWPRLWQHDVRLHTHWNEGSEQGPKALVRAADLLGEGIEVKNSHDRESIPPVDEPTAPGSW